LRAVAAPRALGVFPAASESHPRGKAIFGFGFGFLVFRALLGGRPPPPPRRAPPAAAAADDPRAGAVTYDPLCEFINPLLDDDEKLDCGQEP
jgi:hypothetical protein